jgi:hypothetical protein
MGVYPSQSLKSEILPEGRFIFGEPRSFVAGRQRGALIRNEPAVTFRSTTLVVFPMTDRN